MDEAGISNVPTKMEKVVSTKGKKTVSKVVSSEKGETVTIACAMSPSGFQIPPAIIIPRVRHHPKFYIGAPINTLELHHATGFMTSELFLVWIKHFEKYAQPSKERPVLLILDNHVSHQSLKELLFCREHHIHLLSLSPHCSQQLQPLDVAFFGPLKNLYSSLLDNYLTNRGQSESRLVSMEKVAGLFKSSNNSVTTLEKGFTGFECTGIFPYCPQRFTEINFAPSTVSESELILHFIKFTHRKLTSPNLSNANFSISGPLYSRNDNVADVEDEEDVDGDIEPLGTPQPVVQSRRAATVLFPSLNRATSHSNLYETEGNILNKKW